MDDQRREHFRQKLEQQRQAIDDRILSTKERAQEPVENDMRDIGDAGDESVRAELVDTALELGEIRTREREEIEDALKRMNAGTYGICERCGEPIELDRLEAMPTARLCKDDAERADREQRRPTPSM